jgi:hypothetical protein
MGQGAKVTKFPLSTRTCKHKNVRLVHTAMIALLAHPMCGYTYVNEVCQDCGASRIAEYDMDLDGNPFNRQAALQWRDGRQSLMGSGKLLEPDIDDGSSPWERGEI